MLRVPSSELSTLILEFAGNVQIDTALLGCSCEVVVDVIACLCGTISRHVTYLTMLDAPEPCCTCATDLA